MTKKPSPGLVWAVSRRFNAAFELIRAMDTVRTLTAWGQEVSFADLERVRTSAHEFDRATRGMVGLG